MRSLNNATYKISTVYQGENTVGYINVPFSSLTKYSLLICYAYRYDYPEGSNVIQFILTPRIMQDVQYGANKIYVPYAGWNGSGNVIPGVISIWKNDQGYLNFAPGEISQDPSNKVGIFKIYGLEGGVRNA